MNLINNSKKLRIVFLSHFDLNLYKFKLDLMKELVQKECEIIAMCPKGDYSDKFDALGIRHVNYCIIRRSINPFREINTLFEITRKLKQLKPDIVHMQTLKPIIYGTFAARIAKTPIKIASVSGLGSYFIVNNDNVKKKLIRFVLKCLCKIAFKIVTLVMFYNQEDRDEFITLDLVSSDKTFIIPGEGVDINHFLKKQEKNVLSEKPVKVTMISRLIKDKGIDEFLEAASILKKKWKDKVLFQLVGFSDPGNPYSANMEKIASYKKQGIIEYLGFSNNTAEILEETDIYTLPSYREGLSVSILEAMSMSLPIVTTDVPGCKELVTNGINGYTVPVRDHQKLSNAIDILITQPELRKNYGESSRKIVEQLYSSKVIVNMTIIMFMRLWHNYILSSSPNSVSYSMKV